MDLDFIRRQIALLEPAEQYRDLMQISELHRKSQFEVTDSLVREYQRWERANARMVDDLTAGFRLERLAEDAQRAINSLDKDALQTVARQHEIDRLWTVANYAEDLRKSAEEHLSHFNLGAIDSFLNPLLGHSTQFDDLQRIGGVADIVLNLDQFKDLAGTINLGLSLQGFLEGGEDVDAEYFDEDPSIRTKWAVSTALLSGMAMVFASLAIVVTSTFVCASAV